MTPKSFSIVNIGTVY